MQYFATAPAKRQSN